MRKTTRFGSMGLALALAACSTEGTAPSGSDALLNQDVATVAADVAAQDVEMMRGPVGHFGLGLPADPSKFECTPHERPALTVVRTCIYKDAQGNVQSAYDPVTTASVTVHAEISGSIERDRWGATVSRVRDWTVTGLAGAETSMTWNGTGSGSMTRVRQTEGGETRQFDMIESTQVKDVVIPVPRTATSWPLSGTITHTVKVTITGGPNDGTVRERTVTITFNGTQLASVTVNGTEQFEFDLGNRGRAKRRP